MPELPEVESVRLTLEPKLKGKRILSVDAKADAACPDPDAVKALDFQLKGRRIEGIERRAKYLFFWLDDGNALLVHLRMTGQLTIQPRDSEPPKYERLRFHLSDGNDLSFADLRRFGVVKVLSPVEVEALNERLGIEPLGDGFTAKTLAAILKKRKAPVKAVLLDQEAIAGIGNIYADEALFLARLRPDRPAESLKPAEIKRLRDGIVETLNLALGNGGTTFSSYVNGDGGKGENGPHLLVYGKGRDDAPCPRCGRPLQCIKVGGRSSHFCPHCQK